MAKAKMAKEIRSDVVNGVMEEKGLRAFLEQVDAVQYDRAAYAVPVIGDDGKTYWFTLTYAVGLWEATKVNPAFDPHARRTAWLENEAEKSEKAAEKETAKQAKIKRDTAKRKAAAEARAAKEAAEVAETAAP